jgi:peptide/nickel transport system substrate-binding protein
VRQFVVQSLMARSRDEPFSIYAQIARGATRDGDGRRVTFFIDPRARFHDGSPVTSADARFSFEVLKAKGRPDSRNAKVRDILTPDPLTITFVLADPTDRELALTLGMTPVFQKAKTDFDSFDSTTLKPFEGSGPYRFSDVQPGQSFTLKRVGDYWAAEHPTSRGLYNFDEIKVEFYRDSNSLFEAFKAGLYDIRLEDNPNLWSTGYDFPAVRDGRIRRENLPLSSARGMTGFILNTRRPILADVRVREALGLMFDFEWVNRNLFLGAYARLDSYFAGSELSAAGVPASAAERAWLEKWPGAVREDILEGRFRPAASDGSGRDRRLIQRAVGLFAAAGYRVRDGQLVRESSGEAFGFDIMVTTRPQERLALVFATSLRRIGIDARVRLIDDSQYWKRLQDHDFDVTIFGWQPTSAPGNEQYGRWSSEAAGRRSLNLPGVRSPAVDAAIAALVAATSNEAYRDAVRTLDRLLLSGFYVVPLYYLKDQLFAYRTGIERPQRLPSSGLVIEALWRKE